MREEPKTPRLYRVIMYYTWMGIWVVCTIGMLMLLGYIVYTGWPLFWAMPIFQKAALLIGGPIILGLLMVLGWLFYNMVQMGHPDGDKSEELA